MLFASSPGLHLPFQSIIDHTSTQTNIVPFDWYDLAHEDDMVMNKEGSAPSMLALGSRIIDIRLSSVRLIASDRSRHVLVGN